MSSLGGCRQNIGTVGCIGPIGLELSADEIFVGDTFTATATHVGDGCLNSLSWSATGVIDFQSAEANEAAFHARDSGTGTITAQNRDGTLGALSVDVNERVTTGGGREAGESIRSIPVLSRLVPYDEP